jgi:putative transcriptional regulator
MGEKRARKPKPVLNIKPSYKPLDITLIKKDLNKTDLRSEPLNLAPGTLAKMGKNEYVSLEIIAQICDHLDCRIEEVVEFIPDTK